MWNLLEALFQAVKTGTGKVIDQQREYVARYETYSDERLLREWESSGGDTFRRSALATVMKRRGLRPRIDP
jgi:hypothetical protein